jgi:hypothetical protein
LGKLFLLAVNKKPNINAIYQMIKSIREKGKGKSMNTARKWFHHYPLRYGFAVIMMAVATWLYKKLSEVTGGHMKILHARVSTTEQTL